MKHLANLVKIVIKIKIYINEKWKIKFELLKLILIVITNLYYSLYFKISRINN